MIQFKDFIAKNKGTLSIFDVDETLFNTNALIYVKSNGKVVKKLTNQEYNTYKLKDGETFDFSEFKSADIFSKTSKPVEAVVSKLKALQSKVMKSKLSRTIIVTARSDFDNKKAVVKFFQSHGIDVDNEVYIERAGNIGGRTDENKRKVFDHYLSTGIYGKVVLYDDAVGNIQALLSLKPKYPDIDFVAYLVNGHTGKVRRVTE